MQPAPPHFTIRALYMLEVFKKKNSEYSVKERWFTGIVTAILFTLFSYWGIYNTQLSSADSMLPIGGALLIGIILGTIGYKYPKFIHLTIFALPLMFFGG